MKKDGIKIGKVPGGSKKVKADFKKIFEVIAKTGIMAAVGNWTNAAKEFAGLISAFKIKKEPEEIAYFLILEALINSAHKLMSENQRRLTIDLKDRVKLYDSDDYTKFLDGITTVLEEKEIIIGNEFLDNPKSLELLKEFQLYFKEALLLFGIQKHEADQITNRLPSYFVFELNKVWRQKPNEYELVLEKINTPFSEATEKELQYQAYRSFLDLQIDQPVFEEAFSLRDIFIPLRGYYEVNNIKSGRYRQNENPEKKTTKKVVWVEEALDIWLKTKKTKDEIKMISGGPGSGKSSFAKKWAAKISNDGEWKVIFIPLHLFDIHGNILETIGNYLVNTPAISFKFNPLEKAKPEDRFLLIFDGLDELVMQGKTARDSAISFVNGLEKLASRFNSGDTSILKILIAGRPISVQNADIQLRGTEKQVVHLLPYFLTKDERKAYSDPEALLKEDQRQKWWLNFQIFKELPGNRIPKELNSEALINLTREPLLNYLIALSWTFSPDKFGEQTNINEIYQTLMKGVYMRDYEGRTNANIGNLDEDQFFQILEEIAICAWHGGDVRVTSEKRIENFIEKRKLTHLLNSYKESVKGGVSKLLTAFYFRKYGKDESSESKDDTFEFTHKSFGEYLTARAVVELVQQIYFQREDNKNNTNSRISKGWTKQQALEEWLRVTGETLFDDDLKLLVQNEIQLRMSSSSSETIRNWQLMLCELIAEVSRTGMPFEHKRYNHKTEKRSAQNAEIALLILTEACALNTMEISMIDWESEAENYAWNWLHGIYSDLNQFIQSREALKYLSLVSANLQAANLQAANLQTANLQTAILQNANLQAANLQDANLQDAILQAANLQDAILQDADLQGAILQDANLYDADLRSVNLRSAILQDAILKNADLQFADLQGADLRGANLQDAILQFAKLRSAILQFADLQNAILKNADLQNAILYDAYLQNAILQNADLQGAILKNANLQAANLQAANLQFADLQFADLQNAILYDADLQNANLYDANLQNADLQNADLQNADLQNADLQDAQITIEQLKRTYSLLGCKGLDEKVEEKLRTEHPELF